MKKKIISLVLAIIMAFSVLSVTVIAADVNETASVSSMSNLFDSFIAKFIQFFAKLKALFNTLLGMDDTNTVISGIKVSSASVNSEYDNSISIVSSNGGYYLYLPSNANKKELVFTFSNDNTVKIDSVKVESGKATDILDGEDSFFLNMNGNLYFVQIMQSANIPSMYISTESGNMTYVHNNKENKESGEMVLINADGSVEYDNTLDYIKGRGNSSWKYAKKGYNIKLDKSTDLCNLGKTKKWSLIPNHIDKSLLRNQIVYDLADAIGLEYSPANTPVDLYLNGVYNGTYLMVVKTEIDSASVDITNLEKATEKVNDNDLDTYKNVVVSNANGLAHYKYNDIPNNPEDITGGYILELDHSSYSKEASGFTSNKGQRVVLKAPEYATKAQVEYMANWFNDFEEAVYSADGYNSKGKYYADYIDLESFAKYYIISEIAMNGDSHITSVFMYKESDVDGDGLLHAGPVWDYDSSLGNNGGTKSFYVNVTLTNPAQQFYSISKMYKGNDVDFIYCALYRHSDFRAVVVDVYKNEVAPALNVLLGNSNSKIGNVKNFNEYVNAINASAGMNFTRFNIMANAMTGTQTGTTYEANTKNLYNFLNNKKAFFDKIIDAYNEDYLYIFVDGSNIYGVTSFDNYSVELYKGNATLNSTISHGGKSFKVTSIK